MNTERDFMFSGENDPKVVKFEQSHRKTWFNQKSGMKSLSPQRMPLTKLNSTENAVFKSQTPGLVRKWSPKGTKNLIILGQSRNTAALRKRISLNRSTTFDKADASKIMQEVEEEDKAEAQLGKVSK